MKKAWVVIVILLLAVSVTARFDAKAKVKIDKDLDSLKKEGLVTADGKVRVIVKLTVDVKPGKVNDQEFKQKKKAVSSFKTQKKPVSNTITETSPKNQTRTSIPKPSWLQAFLLKFFGVSLTDETARRYEAQLPEPAEEFDDIKDLEMIGALALEVPYDQLMVLATLPEVESIQLDRKFSVMIAESVPWINATAAYEMLDSNGTNVTGTGVKIAIIDTGVDYTHADLGNCTQAQFLASNCTKVVGGYDSVSDDANPADDHGHGTHVAATAAGNGLLKGVAYDAQVLAYKVLDYGGSGYESWIVDGIQRAVADGADVISMSLGSYDCDPEGAIDLAVASAVDQGVVSVIAAGNSGPEYRTVGSPGCQPKAITVAAACKPSQVYNSSYCFDETIASFSSRGPARIYQKPDIAAPGVMICAARYSSYGSSTCFDSEHIMISGTSMATPHVSGAVALIIQKHPDWTPDQIKAAIKYTADDMGYDKLTQGFGLINVASAVALVTPPPVAFIEEVSHVEWIY